jgi:hypothetical protein
MVCNNVDAFFTKFRKKENIDKFEVTKKHPSSLQLPQPPFNNITTQSLFKYKYLKDKKNSHNFSKKTWLDGIIAEFELRSNRLKNSFDDEFKVFFYATLAAKFVFFYAYFMGDDNQI